MKKQAPAKKDFTFKLKNGQSKKKTHNMKTIMAPTGGVKTTKGKCFSCNMPGH